MIRPNKKPTVEEVRLLLGEFNDLLTKEEIEEYEKYVRFKHSKFGKDNWGEEK